jgi:hypothetical protein
MAGKKDRHLKAYRNKSRQSDVGLAPDDHRPVETQHVDLHPQGESQACQAIEESSDG